MTQPENSQKVARPLAAAISCCLLILLCLLVPFLLARAQGLFFSAA